MFRQAGSSPISLGSQLESGIEIWVDSHYPLNPDHDDDRVTCSELASCLAEIAISSTTESLDLEIPYDAFPRYSSKPRAWLDYLGHAVTGSDGILSVSLESTNGTDACGLDLAVSPGEVYYFHTNGPLAFIDPRISTTVSSHPSSFLDSDFGRALIQRDGKCVFTNADDCEAAHLLGFMKGDEYIKQLTGLRSGGQVEINSIDDPRNGLLLNMAVHGFLDRRKIAFLPTPVRSLESCDVAGADNAEPDTYRLTLQSFSKNPEDMLVAWHDRLNARLRSPLPDDWPPENIFTAVYAGAAVKAWGPLGSAELLRAIADDIYYPEGYYERKEAQYKQRDDRREAREQRRRLDDTEFDAIDLIAMLWGVHNGPALERAERAGEAEAKQRSAEKVTEWLNGH